MSETNIMLKTKRKGLIFFLTTSFFVFNQNFQLEKAPGDVRVITHHCQGGLKLTLNSELHTAIG